ncbi:MAG: alpha/beta hydrolase-fold protein [Pseudohongiellaceae bacterium]
MREINFPKLFLVSVVLLTQMSISPLRAQDASELVPVAAPIPAGLETLEYYSAAVDRRMKFDIVLPEGYYESEARYPVLYLLHGYMQNYTVWGRNLAAAFYARDLNDLIVVLPDAGNSWFINYASSAAGQTNNWEDHIINDVIKIVDEKYRTEPRREGRAIAGLSMGGFGAFALGLRHSDLFVSIGSTSGALSHARDSAAAIRAGVDHSRGPTDPQRQARIDEADAFISKIIDIPGFSTQQERTPKGVVFASAEQAQAYDPFTIIYEVPRSQMPHIYIDAGTEDALVQEAREMAALLMINNVPFDYMQSHGSHNSEYWRRSIGHMMTIQNEVMQRALGKRP